MLKRIFDITLSAMGLVLLSPFLLCIAWFIHREDGGPIFYRGVRAGLGGKSFRILKFRTMVVDAEQIGGPSTADNDPRLTSIGSIMRRFKLDELPQLFNVLLGTMSLVGPRPEVLSEVAEYTPQQRRILQVCPGITDWASIWNSNEGGALAGAADPHAVYKQRIQPTKLKLQLKYCEEQSLGTDLRIIFYTLRKIISKDWMPRELQPFGKP